MRLHYRPDNAAAFSGPNDAGVDDANVKTTFTWNKDLLLAAQW